MNFFFSFLSCKRNNRNQMLEAFVIDEIVDNNSENKKIHSNIAYSFHDYY